MAKPNFNFKQLNQVFLWEIKKQYFNLRYPIIACLSLLLITLVLPQNVCQYLDVHARVFVNIINLIFAFLFLIASFNLIFRKLTTPYGSIEYQKERLSDIPVSIRLGIRILVNVISCTLIFVYGMGATYAMGKFADGNHRYLQIEYNNGIFYTYLICFILVPIVFLTLFLRRYVIDQNKYYFFPFIISILAGTLWIQIKDSMLETFINWPVPLVHLFFIFITLIACGFLFYKCCRYEEEL